MTPDLTVVVPTIRGREASLERTLDAYYGTLPEGLRVQFLVVRQRPTAGHAWNDGAADARGRYLHFTGDDITPRQGWYEAAAETIEQGYWPAPRILGLNGTLEACGSDGERHYREERPDWSECTVSTIPFLLTQDWPGPILPIHYCSDSHFSWLARQRGARFRYRQGYCFDHHWHPVGRARMEARATEDRERYRAAIAEPVLVGAL